MKAGLLMEAAEAHQQLAGAALKRLDAATRGLEPAVREAVEQAVAAAVREELAQVRVETQQTAKALQKVRGEMGWSHSFLAGCAAVSATMLTVAGIAALGWLDDVRTPRPVPAVLTGNSAALAEIERQRVQIAVTLCGAERTPCVRVDPKGGTYTQRRETYLLLPAK